TLSLHDALPILIGFQLVNINPSRLRIRADKGVEQNRGSFQFQQHTRMSVIDRFHILQFYLCTITDLTDRTNRPNHPAYPSPPPASQPGSPGPTVGVRGLPTRRAALSALLY